MSCLIREDNIFYAKKNRVPIKCATASSVARQDGNKLYTSKNHNKKIHLDILSHYSESVAFAEDGSKEMALAYSNRSALLLHLHKYQECLIDIERAYQITKSEELRVKLLTRKMKCMKLMDEKSQPLVKDEDKEIGTIESYAVGKRSKTIPCAYDCVTLAYNEKYGRHVVATKDIEPGQVVAIEKSFVQIPTRDKTFLVCSHCLMFACNGVPCKSCAVAFYCTAKCRDEAWVQYHDIECVVLPYLKHEDFVMQNLSTLLAAVRLFIKSVKEEGLLNIIDDVREINHLHTEDKSLQGFFNDDGIFQSKKFKTIYNLSCNSGPSSKNDDLMLINYIRSTTDLLANNTNIFDPISYSSPGSYNHIVVKIIYKLAFILDCNSYTFQGTNCACESLDECNQVCGELDVGLILLPFCSLLNHSCNVNTNQLCIKNQMFIYTLLPIKKGEQLFLSYSPSVIMEKVDRQNWIKKRHNFTCNCTACRENWSTNIRSDFEADYVTQAQMLMELQKIEEIKLTESLFFGFGELKELSFSSKFARNNVIKMIKIVHKTLTGYKAYMHNFYHMFYISKYFEKLFGAKIFDFSNDCS